MRLFCLFYSLYPSTFSCFFFLFSSPYFLCSKKKLPELGARGLFSHGKFYLFVLDCISISSFSFFLCFSTPRASIASILLSLLVSYYFKEKKPYFLHQTNKKKTLRVLVTSTPRAKVLHASSVVFFVAAATLVL